LAGHFPAAPIVPAVVILDEVMAVLNKWRAGSRLVSIPAVKFLAPLRPAQPFTICLSSMNDGESEIDFCCRVEDRTIVEGRLRICRGSG
jgi:3-hydroxymyristoyl/3-hydroxydecanoyl-(acyl carrier protein) dehydratase